MRFATRVVGVVAGLSAALLVGMPGTADSEPAAVIECSNVFPELGGVIVFHPNGGFQANCHEHLHDGPVLAYLYVQ